jgi:tetratricopeptide (TPR) repeat protein
MTAEQRNDLCSACHGHIAPLTASYKPGDRFFDHFGLATLEINAFYPDGRGLGETFTLTNWLMNPCAKAAKLDCMHCHTSSGRYRFQTPEKANNACLPCHAKRVKNATVHTHHQAGSPGSRCVSCHMAPTYYARMKQSDHSMLPPTPAATIAFKSPNACNNCHTDKDAAWADRRVRKWHKRDYQAAVLRRARLIDDARKGDWKNLPEMLKYIQSKDRDGVFAASLIRLMFMNRDENILPVLLTAVKDPSPLVRSAAAQALGYRPSPETRNALIQAANDDYRVVRISAAYGLTTPSFGKIGESDAKGVNRAVDEFLASLMMHPDLWTSYDITGNVYQRRGRFKEAESAYRTALRIEPRAVSVMLSLSSVYLQQGKIDKAEEILRQAVKLEPNISQVKSSR